MKKLILILTLTLFVCQAYGQQREIKLFSSPNPENKTERSGVNPADNVFELHDIYNSSFIIYPAAGGNNKPCVIVCPGGGYRYLSGDKEGTEICEWLNGLGITAVMLKYRVPVQSDPRYLAPLQDIQRTISWLRHNASDLGIDPEKIGAIGFSAGAHLAAAASSSANKRSYGPADEVDKAPVHLNYAMLIYPGSLGSIRDNTMTLAEGISVTAQTPPTVIVQTQDDGQLINGSLAYYYFMKEAKAPVTMLLYDRGGHGYGMRDTGAPVNEWPARVETWLRERKVID